MPCKNNISAASPSKAVRELSPYIPGLSITEIRDKYNLQNVIKMASNENPLGVSPLARDAIEQNAAFAFRYPQSGNPSLVKAIAKKHGVNPAQVVVGNGSDELIDLLIRVFASEKDSNLVCFEPCFSIYPIQAKINGTKLKRIPLNADFSFDFEKLLETVDKNTSLIFITTPDNPSGYCPPADSVRDFLERLHKKALGALVVIDEAYMDFTDEANLSLLNKTPLPKNAVFSRTFSKSYGLAGVRLGYLILPEDLADWLWRTRLPFSVNILAEQAGIAALEDVLFYTETLRTVKEGRKFLQGELKKLGCQVYPSHANFLMFRPPEGALSAAELHEKLLQAGIIIRKLTSYNLPGYLRVSVGNESENRQFIKAMKKILTSPAQ